MPIADERARGVLLGLAAGDRIGGPIRMALRVAESLRACGRFDADDIGRRYLAWYRDGAFDTGPTAGRVLELVDEGLSFREAAERVDAESGGLTAGCNPAHRAASLALSPTIDDAELADCARAEAALTHRHPLAGDAAAAVVVLCRALVRGTDWCDALALASEGRLTETARALDPERSSDPGKGGFAPEALGAAVHFVDRADAFSAALDRALAFAGSANYCPVLVGSLGGARWGATAVDPARLEVHRRLVPEIEATAQALARSWASENGAG
ncbi:MAG: ADP-ribosylglycohydrolase family protein [Thermoanaerobaculia bacterium]|nr:ADP-ribosylglycohydrolase family protein [Thermoanaerobaculia bacterium]